MYIVDHKRDTKFNRHKPYYGQYRFSINYINANREDRERKKMKFYNGEEKSNGERASFFPFIMIASLLFV